MQNQELKIEEKEINNASSKNASPSKKSNPSKKRISNASKNIQKKIEDKKSYPSIYKIKKEDWDAMNDKEKKSFRSKMRRNLQSFMRDILGRDRSNEEIAGSIKKFNAYFKRNYIAKELDASAIYAGNDASKRKDYQKMIARIKKG